MSAASKIFCIVAWSIILQRYKEKWEVKREKIKNDTAKSNPLFYLYRLQTKILIAMKQMIPLLVLLLAAFLPTHAQQTQPLSQRFIEVTGSSEISVEPDEILFIIRIQEYWREEFEKKTKKTTIPLKYPLPTLKKTF